MNTVEMLRELEAKATEYDGYFVDSNGNVWSASNWRGYGIRKLNPYPNSHGYLRVKIHFDGRSKTAFVHKMVCIAFHGIKPTDHHEVRHLNGNPKDNNSNNLSWGTRSENAKDRVAHGTDRGAENGRSGAVKMLETRRARHGF